MKKEIKNATYEDLETFIVKPRTPNMPDYIPWEIIKATLGARRHEKFMEFMRGQTCLDKGAYPCDVRNFFREEKGEFYLMD